MSKAVCILHAPPLAGCLLLPPLDSASNGRCNITQTMQGIALGLVQNALALPLAGDARCVAPGEMDGGGPLSARGRGAALRGALAEERPAIVSAPPLQKPLHLRCLPTVCVRSVRAGRHLPMWIREPVTALALRQLPCAVSQPRDGAVVAPVKARESSRSR